MPTRQHSQPPNSYPALRQKVQQTLLLGQKNIEKAKVQTYWQTGKLIREHLRKYESRGDHYGSQVIEKLSQDLEISASVLWRCLRFAESFKILAARQESLPANLTWTH